MGAFYANLAWLWLHSSWDWELVWFEYLRRYFLQWLTHLEGTLLRSTRCMSKLLECLIGNLKNGYKYSAFSLCFWDNAPDSNTRRSKWRILKIVLVTSNIEHWAWACEWCTGVCLYVPIIFSTKYFGSVSEVLVVNISIVVSWSSPHLHCRISSNYFQVLRVLHLAQFLSSRFPHDTLTHLLALWAQTMSSIKGFLIFLVLQQKLANEILLLWASNESKLIKPFRKVMHNRTYFTHLSFINQPMRT